MTGTVGSDVLAGEGSAPALVDADGDRVVSYDELEGLVADRCPALAHLGGRVVFLAARANVATVVDYLALRRVTATTVLLDPAVPDTRLDGWVAAYRPDAVLGWGERSTPSGGGPRPPMDDRLLLPTSGTTGSPKFVRLTEANLTANAAQIVTALRIDAADRAVCALPLYYSYGLSVLNSHLAAGASVVLTGQGITRRGFVEVLGRTGVTSLAGVPFSFSVYDRVGLLRRDLPRLRNLTVAGGRLPTDDILRVSALMRGRGGGLWTMYGQTEATARIAVLPPEELPEHAGSVGWAVPGCRLDVADPGPDGVGQVVVTGPQVMLGYAHRRADLGTGDEVRGRLTTGDLGRLDRDGRLWITGRLRRMAKVAGLRVSLDDLEAALAGLGAAAVLDGGDRVLVVIEANAVPDGLGARMARTCGLPYGSVEVVALAAVPRSATGKPDHPAIEQALGRHPLA